MERLIDTPETVVSLPSLKVFLFRSLKTTPFIMLSLGPAVERNFISTLTISADPTLDGGLIPVTGLFDTTSYVEGGSTFNVYETDVLRPEKLYCPPVFEIVLSDPVPNCGVSTSRTFSPSYARLSAPTTTETVPFTTPLFATLVGLGAMVVAGLIRVKLYDAVVLLVVRTMLGADEDVKPFLLA